MIKLTLLAFALSSAAGWSSELWRMTLAAGRGDATPKGIAVQVREIGDSPEPIPPKR